MAHIGGLGGLLLVFHGQQAALQNAQCRRAVLDLALLVLHVHGDAGGDVRHADRGIRGVHGLSAGAGAHEDVDFEVFRIDFDFIVVLVGFREDDRAGGGSLDTSLRFGDGDALHAVHAAFVLEGSPHAVLRRRSAFGADGQLHVLDATQLGGVLALHGDRPAALFRVSHVHTQQVAGKQRRFLTTGAGLDLHDACHARHRGHAESARCAASLRLRAARLPTAWPLRRNRDLPDAISRAASRSSFTCLYAV